MAEVLVVCTGNVCRSPIAEGFLRAAFEARFAAAAPVVASAGTMGWTGSGADPSSIRAAAERGVDISSHRARELSVDDVVHSELIVAMAPEHRRAVVARVAEAYPRTFGIKELVRLLDALPETDPALGEGHLVDRVAEADRLRREGFVGDPRDETIDDPLGRPIDAFRDVARELDTWCTRLVVGLFGDAEARPATGTTGA